MRPLQVPASVYYLGKVSKERKEIPLIDAEIAEKGHFWMETR